MRPHSPVAAKSLYHQACYCREHFVRLLLVTKGHQYMQPASLKSLIQKVANYWTLITSQ